MQITLMGAMTMSLMQSLRGSLVAIVTPMTESGQIDTDAMRDLIEWHIKAKTNGLIIAGTTGESAALSIEEHSTLIANAVKQVAGRVPVIAGTGTNSTATTLILTQNAKKAGADACLIVTPYYVRPTQNGLYQHYKHIADNVDLPILLYNVPGRTGCDLLPETIGRLAQLKNIIGIKDATSLFNRVSEIRKLCPENFIIFNGNDDTALDWMLAGAQGVISVTANVAPEKMATMCRAALEGDRVAAEKINTELSALHKKLFLESNPIPTKWALQQMGKIKSGIRLPLLPLDSKYHQEVKEAMKNAGVI